MSPRTPKQFEEIRKERKEEFLDAALHLFAEEGYHTASVSKIAKRAGVSKGLMYNYFHNKKEVLTTLVKKSFVEATERMGVAPGEVLTREKFIHIIEASIDMAVSNPNRWKLYVSVMFQPDVIPILMEEALPVAEPYMRSLVGYFKSKGYEDPVAMMRIYSALVDGIQMQIIIGPENFPIAQAKQFLIEQFA